MSYSPPVFTLLWVDTQDVCKRMQDNADGFAFSAARYWIGEGEGFPGPDKGGRSNPDKSQQFAIDFLIVAWSETFPHGCDTTGGCTASEISNAMTTFWVVYFAAIAAGSVGILIGKLVNPPGAWYKNLITEAKLQKLHRKAEESTGWVEDVWIGIQLFWFEALWFLRLRFCSRAGLLLA